MGDRAKGCAMGLELVHVVDDGPAMRDSLAFLLGTAGFAVRLYESGTDLLERLATLVTGCVLTDIRMPGINASTSSAACARPDPWYPSW